MFKFITILFIQILCGMEMDLFVPSFPELQRVFNLSPFLVQMTLSLNFVAFCICSLFAGSLGDRYNRRHILLGGLCLFVFGSILCVLAPSYSTLIVGRVLQGIGISAPAILSFPILLESCSPQQQPHMMGMINGVKTLAMAIAPVIGSLVNLYFSWRGNFAVLLGLGLSCLLASFISIPHKAGDKSVTLSLISYLPLLKSQKLLISFFGLSLLTSAYWMFCGMAPILYIDDMNVSLQNYGYYQGSLLLTFAFVCILSPRLFTLFGQKRCFEAGIAICFLSALLMIGLIILQVHQPLLITAVMLLFSIGIVFPINILYPFSLEVLPSAKGRSAGFGQSIVLLLTGSLLELVGYFYNGKFMPIGLAMIISIMLALMLIQKMMKNKWLVFA